MLYSWTIFSGLPFLEICLSNPTHLQGISLEGFWNLLTRDDGLCFHTPFLAVIYCLVICGFTLAAGSNPLREEPDSSLSESEHISADGVTLH